MISCLFPYWEEGNHDGNKKGYTVVHLGDRSFTFFMAIKRPAWNDQAGAFFSPLTLDQSGIVRPTKGKTWHHSDKKSQSRQCSKARAKVRPFMSSKRCDKNQFSFNIINKYTQEKRLRELINDHQRENSLIFYKILSIDF